MMDSDVSISALQKVKFTLVTATACLLLWAVALPSRHDVAKQAALHLSELEHLAGTLQSLRQEARMLQANVSSAASSTALDTDLDFVPYTAAEMKDHVHGVLPPMRLSIPPVPPAPHGTAALTLARNLGWPDAWSARQRPTLFLLGPPHAGSSFLAGCWRYALIGDPSRRAYPMARERWPLDFSPHGEPLWGDSLWGGFSIPQDHLWNRSGYRRWDPAAEWYLYGALGAAWDTWRGYVQRRRFPPVEEESGRWVLLDATPTYLMRPAAAEGVRRDFAAVDMNGALAPRFVVLVRNPLDRAYTHFLSYAANRKRRGEPLPLAERSFARHLGKELAWLRSIPLCRLMLEDPEGVLKDVALVRGVLSTCIVQQHHVGGPRPNFLAFGFAALGLRYWLELFPAERFKAVRSSDVEVDVGGDHVAALLEDVFDMKRMKRRCKKQGDTQNPSCTAQLQYDHAHLFCSKDSPVLAQAWSPTAAAAMNYTHGTTDELRTFRHIAERWDALLHILLDAHGIRLWDAPRASTLVREE